MKYFITDDSSKRKEVCKKHYIKIKEMEPEVQGFFMNYNDFDLNKHYKVKDFELKIKGIDLLMMLNFVVKERKNPSTEMKWTLT